MTPTIEVQAQSLLATFSALLGLYEACLTQGHVPRDLGLPPLPDPNVVVFEGRLRRNGEVLATASLRRTIRDDADWDRAEDEVRRRLQVCGGRSAEFPESSEAGTPGGEASDAATSSEDSRPDGVEPPAPEELAAMEAVEIPKALLDNIRQLALFQGKEVPPFRSVKEAKDFYRKLRAPSSQG